MWPLKKLHNSNQAHAHPRKEKRYHKDLQWVRIEVWKHEVEELTKRIKLNNWLSPSLYSKIMKIMMKLCNSSSHGLSMQQLYKGCKAKQED